MGHPQQSVHAGGGGEPACGQRNRGGAELGGRFAYISGPARPPGGHSPKVGHSGTGGPWLPKPSSQGLVAKATAMSTCPEWARGQKWWARMGWALTAPELQNPAKWGRCHSPTSTACQWHPRDRMWRAGRETEGRGNCLEPATLSCLAPIPDPAREEPEALRPMGLSQ